MKKLISSILLVGLALSCAMVQAHHSFSATFTDEKKSTIEGVVTKFSFRNPHVLVYVDVTNEDGSVTGWVSEGAAATSMRRQGWSARSIEAGQRVRISGDATHDGTPMTSIDYVELLDSDSGAVTARLGEGAGDGGDAYQTEVAESVPLLRADGTPNLSSVWSNRGVRTTRPGQITSIVLNEAGLALQAGFDISTDPQVFCDPVGLVRQIVTPHPKKITQFDDHVLIEYEEFAGSRKIYFDDRAAKGVHTHFGDSIARYEGDKLIIETSHLLANQATNRGYRLTDQTTVTETYSRADTEENGTTLFLTMRISDPAHLAEDIVHDMPYLDQGNYEFIENDCQPPLRERVAVHPAMNFFLTSAGPGDGANLGGLDGADAHCTALAATVGQGDKNWVAYLSTTGDGGVNARDRIAGGGPFYNAKGELVATDVDNLHSESNMLTRETVVNERGARVNARGDTPNRHDILTGTQMDGTALVSDEDSTCSNWTSNAEGSALVGHFDREGGGQNPTSWNQAHGSRGCSQENLQGTGGDGLFYCFAN